MTSPVFTVPYDVLVEIFVHCLPRYPFGTVKRHSSVSSKIAPMLLCHVCSSWRMVAMASPILWSHLSYRLAVSNSTLSESNWAVLQTDFTILQWWEKNQGGMPPYLCLNADIYEEAARSRSDVWVLDGLSALMPYISSAQYLEIDLFFWDQISKWNGCGFQDACSNLHTLVSFWARLPTDWERGYPEIISYRPTHSQPASLLRRLNICDALLRDDALILLNLPSLTHVSLHNITISLSFWMSFIRAIPNLTWGYFDIYKMRTWNDTKPTKSLLPNLISLSVTLQDLDKSLCILFTNLHMPALQTLCLSSFNGRWRTIDAIAEVSDLLKSTPNITTLYLDGDFLSLGSKSILNSNTLLYQPSSPIWCSASSLAHLQLELSDFISGTNAVEELDSFIQNICTYANRWVDLENPRCPIRSITIVHRKLKKIKDLATSRIRDINKNTPNIDLQIISESPLRIAQSEWMKWSSR
ncbi:hypothetical protein BDN70DRAFT_182710 [Pholiota conissans]|uniref:F-box domain-containing protein n=1 Tax=Pholiota conissans TaxID=109636 RepID=A0A9P6D5P5_9AGAR|nr:hypothetical protein BDN70DRAFT_182710 [Pholiota conissans]